MKAEDLPYPFVRGAEPHVVVGDRLWAVPEMGTKDAAFAFPGWNASALFGNDNPVHVEYCSGNGAWIAARAKSDPSVNWVGVEIKFGRVRKIWSKIKNYFLPNLVVLFGEGLQSTRDYIPSGTVDAAYVNFPDPWPKRRHAKNRLIEPVFVAEVVRTLKAGGLFILVTDDEGYSQEMIRVLGANPLLESCYPEPYYITGMEGYGASYFDSLWREKGKTIRFHRFRKKGASQTIVLDGGMKASLDWEEEVVEAKRAMAEGRKIVWQIDLGLFAQLKLPLDNQTQFRSLVLSLDHFVKTVAEPFEAATAGVCLYRGKLDFDTRTGFDYFEALAYTLPDNLSCIIDLDVTEVDDPLLLARTFCVEHRGRVEFVLRGACLPLMERGAPIAVCFPSHEVNDDVYAQIKAVFDHLDGQVYRIIPEECLTAQWDGLDTLIVFNGGLSAAGRRMVQGFAAAGGHVVFIGDISQLNQFCVN